MDTHNPNKSGNALPIRIDKTLQWLEESRSSWKEKTKTTKKELKIQKLAVKRARQSRNELHEELSKEKHTHDMTREELNQKDTEIVALKDQLEHVQAALKKKK